MKKYVFILFALIFISCTSVKKETEQINVQKLVSQDFDDNVFIRAVFNPDFPDLNQRFTANIDINKTDSMAIQIIGPFGISIGRLFSDKNSFVFYNTFENKVYKGVPKSENLKKVIGIDFNYNDLIKILRLSVPAILKDFSVNPEIKSENQIHFVNNSNYSEYISYSTIKRNIINYKRKKDDESTQFEINYSKIKNFKGFNKPSKVEVKIPELNGQITITVNEYETYNENKILSFDYPDKIEVVNLGN